MKTQDTPHVIDFESEYTIHRIVEILQGCRQSFRESLLKQLEIRQPILSHRYPPEMEA